MENQAEYRHGNLKISIKLLTIFESLYGFVREEANIPLQRQPETNFESGNVNFYLFYGGPLGGIFGRKDLKIDFTRNEWLAFDVKDTPITGSYSDLVSDFKIKCYSKQEVLIEKMRSLMERTQPRDIYDLWYLLEIDGILLQHYREEFIKKTAHKGLNHDELLGRLEGKQGKYRTMWKKYLVNQVHDLPDFDGVFRDLMKHLRLLQKIKI